MLERCVINLYAEFLKGLRVCIYLRKSRTDLEEEAKAALRGEKYDTLQKHRAELLRFAKDNELVIVAGNIINGIAIPVRTPYTLNALSEVIP